MMNRLTQILGLNLPSSLKEFCVSKSQKHFTECNLVQLNDGVATLSPLVTRSLLKLEAIVRAQMAQIPAYEVKLPILTHSELLETSGRLNAPNLFRVNATGNKNYILSPTCEEAAASMLQGRTILSNQLPLSFYQISTKFRDEMRPKSGLLRTKEFIMKDLYVFDIDEKRSRISYENILKLYHNFFDILKVPCHCVEGSTGDIGGLVSHEFHFESPAGEDELIFCYNCGHNENLNVRGSNEERKCHKCQSTNVKITTGIEVGHTFQLGTKFTEPFKIHFLDKDSSHVPHMSSYGLGLSRIIAASVESLCSKDKIRWPEAIAPYSICLIPPKAGSKEEAVVRDFVKTLYHDLDELTGHDVIIDDRTSATVGKRILLLDKIGFPNIIVIGKSVLDNPPTVEIIRENSVAFVQFPDIKHFVLKNIMKKVKPGLEEMLVKLSME